MSAVDRERRDGSYKPSAAREKIKRIGVFLDKIDPTEMSRRDTDNLKVALKLISGIAYRHNPNQKEDDLNS